MNKTQSQALRIHILLGKVNKDNSLPLCSKCLLDVCCGGSHRDKAILPEESRDNFTGDDWTFELDTKG